jgi:hypothetical protein
MKIRNGFISNSSSSSFIVGIPNKCATFNDFLEIGLATYDWDDENKKDIALYLDEPVENWETHSDICKTNRDCLEQLWDDLGIKGNKISIDEMIELMDDFCPETSYSSIYYEYQFIDTYCLPHNISNTYRDLYGDKNAEKVRKKLEKIGGEWNHIVGEAMVRDLSQFCNMYAIIYSDNDGEGLMEHGAFWKYVYHIKISQH